MTTNFRNSWLRVSAFTLLYYIICFLRFSEGNSLHYKEYYVTDYCNNTQAISTSFKDGNSTGVLQISRSAAKHPHHQNNIYCTVRIEPRSPDSGILLTVSEVTIKLKERTATKIDCRNYIKIVSTDAEVNETLCIFDLQHKKAYVKSKSSDVIIHFHTANSFQIVTPLQIVFTDFRPADECLKHDGFLCKNENCIRLSLICDGMDNCGDGSDERHYLCATRPPWLDNHLINESTGITYIQDMFIYLIVPAVLLVSTLCYLMYKRSKHTNALRAVAAERSQIASLTPAAYPSPTRELLMSGPPVYQSNDRPPLYEEMVKDEPPPPYPTTPDQRRPQL